MWDPLWILEFIFYCDSMNRTIRRDAIAFYMEMYETASSTRRDAAVGALFPQQRPPP
jgi:hypothetical protein